MRIAIYGTGGVGGYFGARLAQAGEDVVFFARGAHLHALREHGLRVETPEGAVVINPVLASDDPSQVDPVDCIFLCVKTWQVAEAARAVTPLLHAETFVLPLQNGVDAPAEAARVLGDERVLGGLCGTISQIASPGVIQSLGPFNFVKFGELDGRTSARVDNLLGAFNRANVQAEVPESIVSAMWEKFLFVVPFGGLGAVTRAPIGVLRSQPETRHMLESAIREVLVVGQTRGVALSDDSVDRAMGLVDALPERGTTSLQRDIASGKPSELAAWSGAVVRLGREANVATPLHEFFWNCLLPLERRARGELRFPE